jgi:HAD superfamily hydrolase (TIGR01509 family)
VPTPPDAVLFDADGVLQRATIDWRTQLAGYAGPAGTPDDFVADVMTAEAPTWAGKTDFVAALTEVLTRWQCTTPVDEVLTLWGRFEVEPAVVQLIKALRTTGVGCHLATNQQAYRREIMRERGYAELFDREFYSCELGLAKPDPAYFRTILDTIGLPAASVLFIDDNEANVAAADDVGLRAELYSLDTGLDPLRALLIRQGLAVSW